MPTAARPDSPPGKMEPVLTDNLDRAIEQYKVGGYRLDMIFPADDPREALMSKQGEVAKLVREKHVVRTAAPTLPGNDGTWVRGRAGMEYRDLLPDDPERNVAVSHIRLTRGGPVPDYVHYHKIAFQMIYCLKGRIKVVYEDQGEPFWLEPGDCVVQPPEIRHRVLECTARSEVIEASMPAEHETWVDHELSLPTSGLKTHRDFSGQRFIYTRATTVAQLRELLSRRGLGPKSHASLAACAAVEAACAGNAV